MYRPYRPTPHAEQRRLEMNLGTKEVKKALNDPEVIYPGGPGDPRRGTTDHPGDRTFYCRGRIAVVVSDETDEVITILWRGMEYERPSLSDLKTFTVVLS